MNWLYYLAEANLYLGVFYLAYCLFLTNETYYQLNRVYLIGSCVVSFILPVLQIGALKPFEVAQVSTYNYELPVTVAPQLPVSKTVVPVVAAHQLTTDDYLWYAYFVGAAILLLVLSVKLIALYRLVRNAKQVEHDNYKLVQLPQSDTAFSFFNYLFIGKNANGAHTIIRHELVHIRQRHSLDIVFLELLKIINWFNPFIYLIQNSLKTVHEYIADEQTAAHETDPIIYSTFLLNNAYGTGGPSVTHSFFNYNLLKRRIIMLNQKRSGNLAKLRYLIALPVFAASLCASTLAFSKNYGWIDIAPAKATDKIEKENLLKTTPVTIPQDKPGKLPPPTVFKKGFGRLMGHLQHSVTYTDELKNEKNTYVGVSFNVGADRKISNIELFKPANNGYDAVAKAAFESFDGVVTAAPGKHTFMLNYYSDKGPTDPEYLKSKYDVNLVIVKPKPGEVRVTFPPPTPPKAKKTAARVLDKNYGYATAGRLNNGALPIQTIAPKGTTALFVVDGKKYEFTPETLAKYNAKSLLYMSCDKMVVYEQGNPYAEKTWGKYGKVAVLNGNAAIRIVEFPFGKESVKANADTVVKSAPLVSLNGATAEDLREFGRYLGRNVKYPSADRTDAISGKVITVFEVDAAGNLQYAKVVRTPSGQMGEEIVRVLKKWPKFEWFKPGVQYAVPINFTVEVEGPKDPEIKSRVITPTVYNPNNITITDNKPSYMLSDIVIRGYLKRS